MELFAKVITFFYSMAQGPTLTQQEAFEKLIKDIVPVCQKYAMIQSINDAKKSVVDRMYQSGADFEIAQKEIWRLRSSLIAKLIFGNNCALYELPKSFKKLFTEDELLAIFYFSCFGDKNGWNCGYYSVAYAVALQKAFNENKIDTAFLDNSVQDFFANLGQKETSGLCSGIAYCQKYLHENSGTRIEKNSEGNDREVSNFPCGSREFLDAGHLVKLCSLSDVSLPNLHILIFSCGKERGIFFEHTAPGVPKRFHKQDVVELKQSCIELIKNDLAKSEKALHLFICNLREPRHWILIAVIKLQKKPVITILDSYNLSDSSDMQMFTKFIHDSFVKNYEVKDYKAAVIA